MVLKRIITRNIQSHHEVVIDLPPHGLVVFTGNNNNGKTVIIRVTRDILLNHLKHPQTRADLVNKNATQGEVIYEREDGMILRVTIAREAARTYFSLTIPGQVEPIVRYLSDKSYMELVNMFGWTMVEDADITLNIAESEDSLLFYKTPYKVNDKIFKSARTDYRAETALANFEEVLKDTRKFRDNTNASIRTIQSTLSELKEYNVEEVRKRRNTLAYYHKILSELYIPNLPVIKAVPKITFHKPYIPNVPAIKAVPKVRVTHVHIPNIPQVKYPKIYKVQCSIPDILPIVRDIVMLKQNKCPTCGRGF